MLMVLCELLLFGVVLRCLHVVAFRVVVLRRVFFPLLFSDTLLFYDLLLRTVCHFSVFLLGAAFRRVVAVRRRIGVRHLTVFCFAGIQVYRWSMFFDKRVALLMVFYLFVEFQVAYCRVGPVDWYCTCPEIVIVGVRRVCYRLCLLLILTCSEC